MNNKTMIIAEAGVNHNGDINLAKQLIQKSAEIKADIIKFQTFTPESLATKFAQKASYQKQRFANESSQIEMLQKLHLSESAYSDLQAECKKCKIEFLSSPFDIRSIDFLAKIGVSRWKIPSGEITNYPYLKKISELEGQIILSTGMANLGEIEAAIRVLDPASKRDLIILHCNTEYPTPFDDVNLNAMITLKREFGFPVGYSDHTNGIEVAIAAVAMGAIVIEKHFTLDKTLEGPDHKASIEPHEFGRMVQAIRNIERSLGNGIKKPSPSESKNIPVVRKSIVASRQIEKDEIFTSDNITTKRPGTGISPMRWQEVIGKKAGKTYNQDELIEL